MKYIIKTLIRFLTPAFAVTLFFIAALASAQTVPLDLTGSLDLGIYHANAIAVSGTHAYIAACDAYYNCDGAGDDFIVLDTSTPAHPVKVGGVSFNGNGAWDMAVSGNYAYVASFPDFTLRVMDISNPANPRQVASLANYVPIVSGNMRISGNYLYAVMNNTQLSIVDISNPLSPYQVSSIPLAASQYGVFSYNIFVKGNYVYAGLFDAFNPSSYHVSNNGGNDVIIVDTTSKSSPTIVGGMNLGSGVCTLFGGGNMIYVHTCDYQNPSQNRSYDISSPLSPQYKASPSLGYFLFNMDSQTNFAYFGNGQSMQVFNVSNPTSPANVASYSWSGSGGIFQGLKTQNNYAYLGLITQSDGASAPDFGIVNLNTLVVSPTIFNFTSYVGSVPASQSITLSKNSFWTGPDALNWVATSNQTWCHVSPGSGTVAASPAAGSATPVVSLDAINTPGSYNCTVTFTDQSAHFEPKTAAITYVVTASPPSDPSTGDPGPGGGNGVSGGTCDSYVFWQGASGATGYNVYRSVGVNAFSSATLIASNIPPTQPIPNPYLATYPDTAKYDPTLTAIFSGSPSLAGTYYVWDDLTASTQSYNYYWVQAVGSGSGYVLPLGGAKASTWCPTTVIQSGESWASVSTSFSNNNTSSSVSVPYGSSLVLKWNANDFTSCSASGPSWSGNLPLYYDQTYGEVARHIGTVGTQTLPSVTASGTYTMSCVAPTNIDGVSRTSTAVLNVSVVAAPTATLSATPSVGTAPMSTTLSWTTGGNPTSCTASGGTWSGSKNIAGGSEVVSNITNPTTYTLTCVNASGSVAPSVTVSPTLVQYSVTVNKSYGGNVQSLDGNINCGSTCSANYSNGSTVTLVPAPNANGWKFIGWTGACSGAGNCVLNVGSPKTVTPKFAAPPPLIYKEL